MTQSLIVLSEPGPEVSVLLDFIKEIAPENVLEVGCNYGRELRLLTPYTKVFGIDSHPDRINLAKEYVPSGTFVVGDATKLPFPDNSFKLVYTDGCMSHNRPEDIKQILDEMERVSSMFVLVIEWIGTRLGPSLFGNCKKNSWIHNYKRFLATKDVRYTREDVFATDKFYIGLIKKFQKDIVFEKKKVEPKLIEPTFMLKLGRFVFKVEKRDVRR